jgi:hypothetical protein
LPLQRRLRRIKFGLKIMDVYHRVLARLYEVTDGKDSKTVDLKDLVKGLGFLGNYPDIFERLSGAGWIAEDKKANFVRITHWGVLEVKKSPAAAGNQSNNNLKTDANMALAEAKELGLLLEIFAKETSKENLSAVERKIDNLQAIVNQIKSKLNQIM